MCIQETYTHDAAGHTQKVKEKAQQDPKAVSVRSHPPPPPPPFRLFRLLAKRPQGCCSQIGCLVFEVGLSSKPYSANQREL